MKPVYRLARIEDLQDIWDLLQGARKKMETEGIFQWDDTYPDIGEIRQSIQQQTMTVGCLDGKIVVCYVLDHRMEPEYVKGVWTDVGDAYYVLHRFCIHAEYQRKGLAKQTLAYMEQQCQKKGIHAIRLDVFRANLAAVNMYQHADYVLTGWSDWVKGPCDFYEKVI